jgi:hypothetical protein
LGESFGDAGSTKVGQAGFASRLGRDGIPARPGFDVGFARIGRRQGQIWLCSLPLRGDIEFWLSVLRFACFVGFQKCRGTFLISPEVTS